MTRSPDAAGFDGRAALVASSGLTHAVAASLAGMLNERGFRVTGSDAAAYPPMSELTELIDRNDGQGRLASCELHLSTSSPKNAQII